METFDYNHNFCHTTFYSEQKPSAATLCVSATLLSIKGLVQSGSIMTIVLYIDHAWPSLGGGYNTCYTCDWDLSYFH